MKQTTFNVVTLRQASDDYEVRCTKLWHIREGRKPATREDRAYNRNLRSGYEDCVREERRFQEGQDLECLSAILSKFMEAGNIPAILTNASS